MASDWIGAAREELYRLRGSAPGWGYRPGAEPFVEPTVLSCLGLMATEESPSKRDAEEARACGDWVAKIQQPDGSIGLSESLSEPKWCTTYAILLWSSLGGHSKERQAARDWLLNAHGNIFPKNPDDPIGHDTSIDGWPWVAGTHPWVEPTALAVIALRREGLGAAPRTLEGVRMLRDRAIPTGGWNVGNSEVFGQALRPRPATTGLALLGLAVGGPADAVVEKAIAYLESELPLVRSAESLGWGLLGLAAWSKYPKDADTWLSETFARTMRRSGRATQLGHLLLAARGGALSYFGINAERETQS